MKDELFRLISFVPLPSHSSKWFVGAALNWAHVPLGLSLLVGRVEFLVVGLRMRKTSIICRKVGCTCFCSFLERPKVQTVKLVHQKKKLHAVLLQKS